MLYMAMPKWAAEATDEYLKQGIAVWGEEFESLTSSYRPMSQDAASDEEVEIGRLDEAIEVAMAELAWRRQGADDDE